MNFRCISHHSFWCFSGTFFKKLSCRISSFFEGLLFERHAFYTVNTMVLTHSAHRKSLVSISEKKKTKKNNFSLNSQTVSTSNFHSFSRVWIQCTSASLFYRFFHQKCHQNEANNYLADRPGRGPSSDGRFWPHFGLPFGSLGLPFGSLGLPFGSLGLPFGSLGLPFGSLGLTFGTLGLTFGSLLASFGSLLLSPGHFFHIFMYFR